MLEVIRGSSQKPVTSGQLARHLTELNNLDGILYIGYPILGSPEGAVRIDALLVSPQKGVIIFDLVEGKTLDDAADRQDQAYRRMQAKLLQHSSLSQRRKLMVDIWTATFAPAVSAAAAPDDDDPEHPIALGRDRLVEIVEEIDSPLHPDTFRNLVSVIQTVTTIRSRPKKRDTTRENSRGAIAAGLEASIATLDAQQSAAVIQTIDGVQQIRGLAGSGKTIVLALKVAYLHAQNPDWKIAVTFGTRSLKGTLKKLIYTFVIEQTGREPDFDNVQVMNAWGAAGGVEREGLYYRFCKENALTYMDFGTAKNAAGMNAAFDHACTAALAEKETFKPVYDAILVDEAQDFRPSFLRLCYEFLKSPKRLVYAFDELQNLTADTMPPPEEIFGKDESGQPRVRFAPPTAPDSPRQDIVLDVCYRNSRPILVTAHALGFGIYRKEGLCQIFGDAPLWEDIGYEVRDGELADGKDVRLARTPETSPEFLEEHSSLKDIVVCRKFESEEAQTAALVAEIKRNLAEDELEPEDIIVINTEAKRTREQVAAARAALFQEKIDSELAGVSRSPDEFFSEGAVTFTGIFRAKGNEAPMVYVINSEYCAAGWTIETKRNILFTAITRSKAWVRIFGVGPRMDILNQEVAAIRQHNFELAFRYPTPEERETMRTYQRRAERRRQLSGVARRKRFLSVLKDLEEGKVTLKDVPPDVRDKIKKLLG